MKRQLFIINFIFLSMVSIGQNKWKPGVIGYASSGYFKSKSTDLQEKSRGLNFLPSSFSLRDFAPSVGEQQGGTCVGWATTYAGLSILENIKNNIREQTKKDSSVFSPYFTYTLCKNSYDNECEEGLYIEKALNSLQSVGAIKEKDFKNICSNVGSNFGLERVLNNTSNKLNAAILISTIKKNRLKGFIPIAGIDIVQNMKYYLNKKMPIIVGVEMYQSIVKNLVSNVWTGVIDDYPGGHAMCVVGYDDNKYGGAFEIMNSWGKAYGDSGFIWFRYIDFAKIADAAYALSGIENSENLENTNFDFNVSLSAIGANSSKIIPIEQASNYYSGSNFSSQSSLLNKYIVNYSEDDQSYRLSISSKNESPLFVYMLSFKNSFINLETSFSGKINVIDTKNGLILPTNSYSGYTLSKDDYRNKPYCLLVCKTPIDENLLIASIEKQYNSIEDYLQSNFNKQLCINKPKLESRMFDDKIEIVNKNEPNAILPIIIDHKLDKTKNNLFTMFDIITTDYILEDRIEETLSKFKLSKQESKKRNLSIKCKVQKNSKGYVVSVSCRKLVDIFDEIFNDESSNNYKKVNQNLFQFSLSGSSKTLSNTLEKQLFINLSKAKIPFHFSSN